MTIRQLRERAEGLRKWLGDTAPYLGADQKHLDEGTPERAYWHAGYRSALIDAANLLSGDNGENAIRTEEGK